MVHNTTISTRERAMKYTIVQHGMVNNFPVWKIVQAGYTIHENLSYVAAKQLCRYYNAR